MNSIDRTKPPSAQRELQFHLPQIEKFKLPNGLNLLYVKKEKLPIIQMLMLTSAGAKFEEKKLSGLSHLTGNLIDEGAAEYDALQLNNEIEKLGSIINIRTNGDFIYSSLLTLSENLERSTELFSEILTEPRLENTDFEREKKKVLNKIIQMKDEPSLLADSVFKKILFNNSFYELPEHGTQTTVSRLKLPVVKSFYQKYFSASNSTLIAAGITPLNDFVSTIEKYFSSWKAGEKYTTNPILINRNHRKFYLIHKENAAQSEIRIGHQVKGRNDGDYFRRQVLNTILGGQFSSRINLNLRERHGFTYGANSSFNYMQSAAGFEVSTAVKSENTGEAVSEILNELNKIRETITEEEISFAKSYLIKRFPSRFETYLQIALNISSIVIHDLPKNFFNTYLQNITSVTIEEVLNAAKDNIFPEESVIVVVGDKNIVEDQLLKISEGNLTEINYNDEFFEVL